MQQIDWTTGFLIFVIIWMFVLLFMMTIGGFFMFRKFFKVFPRRDGKSKLDWQNYYVDESRHLWTPDSIALLRELAEPVPKPFRDIAQHTIAARIGRIALEEKAQEVTEDHCIRGYILATPKRDHKFLRTFLEEKGIDHTQYAALFEQSANEDDDNPWNK